MPQPSDTRLAAANLSGSEYLTGNSVGSAPGGVRRARGRRPFWLWGAVVRTILVWHITWCGNSFPHLFGYRNYETRDNSRNNFLVALLTNGEGWHNNHHAEPGSASNQHHWWELDMTYVGLKILVRLGLASNVQLPKRLSEAAVPPL